MNNEITRYLICRHHDGGDVKAISNTLHQMMDFMGDIDVEMICYSDIRAFVAHLIDQYMDLADFTPVVRKHYNHIKGFIYWCYLCGDIIFSPLKVPDKLLPLTIAQWHVERPLGKSN